MKCRNVKGGMFRGEGGATHRASIYNKKRGVSNLQYVGWVAALLTTLSFLPQAIKTVKEKNTEGISLGMYGMFTSGVLLWLIYGLSIKDIPLILANFITFIFACIILIMKLKYK